VSEPIEQYPLRAIVDTIRFEGFQSIDPFDPDSPARAMTEAEAQHLAQKLVDGPLADPRVLSGLVQRLKVASWREASDIRSVKILGLDEEGNPT
jgi:hypothetical protein